MSSVRPRQLAVGFGAYFGLVAYLAWSVAFRSEGFRFNPAISQMVYQTTMIGGVIVLTGLLGVASLLPHASRPKPPDGLAVDSRGTAGSTAPPSDLRPAVSAGAPASHRPFVEEGDILDSAFDGVGYTSPRRARDAAAVSAALTRMQEGKLASTMGLLMERLAGIRSRNESAASSEREMTETLGRLVEEMRPLLVAASDAGLDVGEVRRLYNEATIGHEWDLAYRLRLVERMKETLEAALSERASRELQSLHGDLEEAKALTDQARSAELTAAEAVALLDTGHYAAAFNRARNARQILEEQVRPRLQAVPSPAAPASFVPFLGPALTAAVYVAIAAMLLPGVDSFLVTNSALNAAVILFLSYGWFGLVLYGILSIFIAAHPPSLHPKRWRSSEDDF